VRRGQPLGDVRAQGLDRAAGPQLDRGVRVLGVLVVADGEDRRVRDRGNARSPV
jgi:hypothetical protein